MEYLLLGKVIKPHGLNGEVKIFSKTDFANLRYKKGSVVFYFDNDNNEYKPLTVVSFFKQNNFDVVSFKQYQDIDSISKIINKEIYIKKEDAILPKNHYHFVDLCACKIYENNIEIGNVIEVLSYPANYCLKCINNDKKIFIIPFVDEFILNINLNKKRIDVKLIEGIL